MAEVARILGVHPRTVERENWIYWLTHPVPALEDRRPLDLMAEDGLDRAIEAIGRMSLQALVPHGARKRVFGDRLPHLSAPARGSLVSSAVHLAFAKNGTPATAAVFSAAPGGRVCGGLHRPSAETRGGPDEYETTAQVGNRVGAVDRNALTITQEIGTRAWENGVEALLVPSAAHSTGRNLAVFLDNQLPLGEVGALRDVRGPDD